MPIRCIAVVAPASPPAQAELELILERLKQRYPEIKWINYAASQALSEQQRFDLLWQALSNEQVDLLWSFRGGEGSADLIPYLEAKKKEVLTFNPKILLGFSDITALLFYWHQTLKWPAIHGPCAVHLERCHIKESSVHFLDQLIQGELKHLILDCAPFNEKAYSKKVIQAPVFAANLTLLTLAQRELWEPLSLRNSILIIEDVAEPTYRVRRALSHLKRIGFLNELAALVIGDFFSKPLSLDPVRDQAEQNLLRQFLKDFARELPYPVYQTDQVGHGESNILIGFGWQGSFSYSGLQLEVKN